MPTVTDFRTIRCQATLYTPEMQFRSAKVLAYLFSEYGSWFDGETWSLPPHLPEGLPREMPQIILKSADGKLLLQAGSFRLDMIREGDPIADSDMAKFFRWATALGLNYLQKNQAKAGRIACVLNRAASDAHPAKTLSRHFCQQRWLDKPFNRLGDFQLHGQKQFRLDNLFEINSWVRCKCGALAKVEQRQSPLADSILVEQDFNSLAEQTETRELSPDEIARFFEIAPLEMRRVLELYFPPND